MKFWSLELGWEGGHFEKYWILVLRLRSTVVSSFHWAFSCILGVKEDENPNPKDTLIVMSCWTEILALMLTPYDSLCLYFVVDVDMPQ